MSERIYHTMKSAGTWNMVIGIVLIVAGVALGVLNVVAGARLLRDKSEITF